LTKGYESFYTYILNSKKGDRSMIESKDDPFPKDPIWEVCLLLSSLIDDRVKKS
jgi:hypothetical protein